MFDFTNYIDLDAFYMIDYLVEIPTAGPSADTLISRNHTKMQHCSLLRQSAKRKVDRICAMKDKLLYRDEVQSWAADQFRLLSSRGHRAIRALI